VADLLTHVFLPLTAVYVLRPDLFQSPLALSLGGVGLLADADKFLGQPGSLHSLLTLGPLCALLVAGERRWRGDGRLALAPVLVALIGSHLVLDVVDGGPVPLLYPLVETGIGLQYPAQTVFGEGPLGVTVEGPLVTLRTATPRPGFNTYGLLRGSGVASTLLFLTVYAGREWGPGRDQADTPGEGED